MKCRVLKLWLAAALTAAAFAQTTSQPAAQRRPPAPPPESTQFDFWVGHWDVFNPAGAKIGENRIEKIASDWGLLENWTGAGGGSGKSLNAFNAAKKTWQQYWVGSSGVLELSGGLRDGAMVMTGESSAATGTRSLNRITWTPGSDGTVRQHWEVSSDDGETWTTTFDGTYRRKR